MKTVQIKIPEGKDLKQAAKVAGSSIKSAACKTKDAVTLPFQFLSFSYGLWKGMKEGVAATQIQE